jgi:phenylacetate-CoA ligase
VIGEVVGRATDFVVRADGTIMHALAVIYVLRAVEGVAEFKLVQHTTREVEVLVRPSPRWNDGAREAITRGLAARLGEEAGVTVTLVDSIPPEVSGKHRYVVSRVPLPGGLARALAGAADPAGQDGGTP